MLVLTPEAGGHLKLADSPLGKGGEGSVYAVESHTLSSLPSAERLVAKLYHDPTEGERLAKLKAMVQSPVATASVAWPQALVFDDEKKFLGYLMVKLEQKETREWLYLANSKERNNNARTFDVRYALMACRNLAAAILAVHEAGHVIGDINESNIAVKNDASVLIIDSDSMQITGQLGDVFPCVVGKPEYTAPELSYESFRTTRRTVASDAFAFAVACFQLLTGGVTPHQGAFDPNSQDDPMPVVERIRRGVLPSLKPAEAKQFGFTPRPGVPVEAFPSFLKAHFIAFLSGDPKDRLARFTLESFIEELDKYLSKLVRCGKEPLHWHEAGSACLWCAEALKSGNDPWGVKKAAPEQAKLPSIDFHKGGDSGAVRAAPAVAGPPAAAASTVSQLQGLAAVNPAAAAALASYAALASATPAPAPVRPKKIKGKVTVDYADGTWGVRPPLYVMYKQSPKMFLWAVKEETWSILRFWWTPERKLARSYSLFMGIAILLGIAYANFSITFELLVTYLPALGQKSSIFIASIPAFTGLLAGALMITSAFKAKTRPTPSSNFEHPILTLLNLAFIGAAYGVPLIAVGVLNLVGSLLQVVFNSSRR